MDMELMLKKYAKLAVKKGVNVQENQTTIINSPIECAEFARAIAEAAYQEGAKEVVVHYNDEKLQRIKFQYSTIETLSNIPEWISESYNLYARNGANVISISASNPDAYKGISMEKIVAFQKARQLALKEFYENTMSNNIRWTVVSVPTASWAKKVFPESSEEEAISQLWDVIFKVVRIDCDDPIKAWDKHNENLKKILVFLNNNNFKKLHFTSSNGTDLTVDLPKGHIWLGGSEFSTDGFEFNANMPTEEVFTAPHKYGVNGTVFSSKPLIYGGNVIDKFKLTFKDGKVVDFHAEKGKDVLQELINNDEGSCYLGEVALVPFDSPISNSNLIFFNTLFDENAACHLALGKAYPICLANGTKMTSDELELNNVNTSLTHVDFMIGTKDLEILGITENKEGIIIFKNGNWAF